MYCRIGSRSNKADQNKRLGRQRSPNLMNEQSSLSLNEPELLDNTFEILS